MPQARLTSGKFTFALKQLHDQDRDLAYVLDNFGDPPMWQRERGLATLIHIILEQQVSLASAATLYGTDAANGVLVITTKRGQSGRTRWTANTEQGRLL